MNIKRIGLLSAISVGYLLLSTFLIGYKPQQLFLVLICNVLYYASHVTRRLFIGLSVFVVFWIIFDYMKAFPNYRYNSVHIEDIYDFEKKIFGVASDGKLMTLNEYFALHHCRLVDLFAGFSYLCWMPVPISFGIYLLLTHREKEYFHFSLSFLLINFIGFIIYYAYPAAPPWYVALHGFSFNPHTAGETAGLGRFDAMIGFPVFKNMYSQSSNVFAAMPSLHAAYPTITVIYAFRNKVKYGIPFFILVMLGIWFGAVYSGHHYVLDILGGIACTVVGYFLYRFLYRKNKKFQRLVDHAAAAVRK